ncbi:MAG: hypothetical protein JWO94_3690, partial [Verrucomicrobiaceae bacterium]|nr:hypothetical protein [Verrucomicrobiaceae bacterium]
MPDSPPIRYSKLVCLITGHDAEWSRRPASKAGDGEASLDKAFNRVFAEVERMCTEFRTNLNKFAQLAYPERCAGEAGEWEVPAHFFRPLRYQPVGHADAMSVTIFDDLDPIHSLTARCTTTVEEVAVGFAPFVDSLRREPWPAPFDGCLVDVEEFVRLGAVTEEHPVQELPPLLLFSRIKLGALGLLGQGIEFQTAVFRAIVSDCLTGLKTLHALAEGDGLAEFEADQESVTSCRIALLDLQGQEEIGLLIATDNYSVAGALLSRIQGLRLNELPQQPARPLKIEAQPWLLKARELLMDMTGETGPGGGFEKTAFDESIMNSHALRWTRSTLAMRQDVFKDPVGTRVRGYIDMVSAANIAVGHQEKLDEALKEMQDSAAPPGTDAARVQAAGQKEEHSGPPEAFRLQLMGHADLLVHQNHPGRNRLRLIKTRQALAQVRELIEKMSDTEGADKQMPRHLAGLSSWPTVPVPKHDDFRRKLKSHYPVLQKIL